MRLRRRRLCLGLSCRFARANLQLERDARRWGGRRRVRIVHAVIGHLFQLSTSFVGMRRRIYQVLNIGSRMSEFAQTQQLPPTLLYSMSRGEYRIMDQAAV